MESPAIIISTIPSFTSCIFTKDHGPFVIHAHEHPSSPSNESNDKPNISSLSLLRIEDLANIYSSLPDDDQNEGTNNVDIAKFEIRIFDQIEHSDSNSCDPKLEGMDVQQEELLETVSLMPGLQERLMDASQAIISNTPVSSMEIFLLKSDAIVKEFLSAVAQYLQKAHRIGNNASGKRKVGEMNSTNGGSSIQNEVPLGFFDALHKQCMQVDQLLEQYASRYEEGQDGIILNEDLSQITICYHDEQKRRHELIGILPYNFPLSSPNWICDLPCDFVPKWMRSTVQNSALAFVVKGFIDFISLYQGLWDEMDDIDSNAWVLEPSLPARRSCCERRVALRSGLSIQFTIDSENATRSVPLSMRFIGSSKDIGDLRNAYRAYISLDEKDSTHDMDGENKWSESLSIRENLKRCFGFPLPSPETTEKDDFIVECGICYAHRIVNEEGEESVIPSITCSSTNCARSYHDSCLSEWLQSLPGANISFGRIFGTCPYCCDSISVKVSGNFQL
jgi:E3 ubiquitin-protein ligase FANCL